MNLEEVLGAKSPLVMSEYAMRQYVFDRKLHPEGDMQQEQLGGLREIIIHNGKHTNEVERDNIVGMDLREVVTYTPRSSSENHYYIPSRGVLHVVNSRGVVRLKRDLDLAKALGYFLDRDLKLFVNHYEGASSNASHRFEHFAFLLVKEAFDHLDMSAIEDNGRLNMILGPHVSLDTSDVAVEHEKTGDYLNYRILRVGKEVVINFDYIFGDQARNVLHQVYTTLSADLTDRKPDVNVFHYGKVGILNPDYELGQIVVPVASIDEDKIITGRSTKFPLYNELAANSSFPEAAAFFRSYVNRRVDEGTTINTISVIAQTYKDLLRDMKAGGDILDMEWGVMAGTSVGSESIYPGLGDVHYYLAGECSDKPLQGNTLGNTLYQRDSERVIASAFKEIIRAL